MPLVLGPVTNGESLPVAAGPGDVRLAEEVLARADAAAGRIGMDRRRFLQSAGGMAALLGAINAAGCTGTGRRLTGPHRGGRYRVPAPEHLPASKHPLSSPCELIFSLHPPHVMPTRPSRRTPPTPPPLLLR